MSKRLIVFVVAIVGIVLLVVKGVPMLGASNQAVESKSQVHVIDGVLNDKPDEKIDPEKIGKFSTVTTSELNESEKSFVNAAISERGVFQKGNLIVLSLGVNIEESKSIKFVGQEVGEQDVKIYVDLSSNGESNIEKPSYLIGRISLPESTPVSFIDNQTRNLLY